MGNARKKRTPPVLQEQLERRAPTIESAGRSDASSPTARQSGNQPDGDPAGKRGAPADRRQWSRFSLPHEGDRVCTLRLAGGAFVAVTVLDVSLAGVRLQWPDARLLPSVGEQVRFEQSHLTHWGEVLADAGGFVRWVRGREVGVLLVTPLCAKARARQGG